MDGEKSGGAPLNPNKVYFLRDLEKLGVPMSGSVLVNGRRLMLSALIKLVHEAPEDCTFARRGYNVTVEPDPFAHAQDWPARDPELHGMVNRLIERQPETDRVADRERHWWQRLLHRLTGRR